MIALILTMKYVQHAPVIFTSTKTTAEPVQRAITVTVQTNANHVTITVWLAQMMAPALSLIHASAI